MYRWHTCPKLVQSTRITQRCSPIPEITGRARAGRNAPRVARRWVRCNLGWHLRRVQRLCVTWWLSSRVVVSPKQLVNLGIVVIYGYMLVNSGYMPLKKLMIWWDTIASKVTPPPCYLKCWICVRYGRTSWYPKSLSAVRWIRSDLDMTLLSTDVDVGLTYHL